MPSTVVAVTALDWDGLAEGVLGLGPGRRVVAWVRGCGRGCPGCMAGDLQTPGVPTPLPEVVAALHPAVARADGLTISGGEPFDQAPALLAVLAELGPVELMIYTGYTLDELRGGSAAQQTLLARCDLLMDGPFRSDLPNTLAWRGSDNQVLHLLSERAQRWAEWRWAAMPAERPLQIQLRSEHVCRLIGLPRRGDLERYRVAMAARGWEVVGHE